MRCSLCLSREVSFALAKETSLHAVSFPLALLPAGASASRSWRAPAHAVPCASSLAPCATALSVQVAAPGPRAGAALNPSGVLGTPVRNAPPALKLPGPLWGPATGRAMLDQVAAPVVAGRGRPRPFPRPRRSPLPRPCPSPSPFFSTRTRLLPSFCADHTAQPTPSSRGFSFVSAPLRVLIRDLARPRRG